MPDSPRLTPATADDLKQALAFALRFEGRKRVHRGNELMAAITAERLFKYLEQSGSVVMRRPPAGELSRLQSGAKAKP
jgi:hypothetical protein